MYSYTLVKHRQFRGIKKGAESKINIILGMTSSGMAICNVLPNYRDTPKSDIVGDNLFQCYIDPMKHRRRRISVVTQQSRGDPELPDSRKVSIGANFSQMTIETFEGILVCTGIYQAGTDPKGNGKNHHGHRDFPVITDKKITDIHMRGLGGCY